MYPRNNASPERIAIGQVILIADGTIQTAAVVITVRGQGGAEASGAGTTAYGAEGTVYYTPTQAETNFTSFTVIASKASCFSASQTIITTQSAIAGQVRLEGVVHTGAEIPLVTVTTTNSDMRGTDSANTVAPDNAGIASIGVEVAGLNGEAMRGTDNANTTTPDNAGITTIINDLANGADGLGALKLLIDAVKLDTASGGIPKNAAFPDFEFPMVLTSDHYTAATGLTVTGQRSIDGGAFANMTATITEVGSGVYQADLTAADTNGDTITYKFSGTNADDSIVTIITRS